MSLGDRLVGCLEDFGGIVLDLLYVLAVILLRIGLPLGVIFAVVYLAVRAAQ